ncbi:MAG: hypothetical protein WDO17_16100 [Alphaproteobacteria bacterium]
MGFAVVASLAVSVALTGLPGAQSSEARQAIPLYGNIIQSGTLAGWASGARISSSDGSVVEFEQISHARQLAQQNEFEYGGLKMRIAQILQMDYAPANEGTTGRAARPDITLLRVTARIQPPR